MGMHMAYLEIKPSNKGVKVEGMVDDQAAGKDYIAGKKKWIPVQSWSIGSAIQVNGQTGNLDAHHWPGPLTINTRTSVSTIPMMRNMFLKAFFDATLDVYQNGYPQGGAKDAQDKEQKLVKVFTIELKRAVVASVLANAAEGASTQPMDTWQIYAPELKITYVKTSKFGQYPGNTDGA
jgi:hypothetical protein